MNVVRMTMGVVVLLLVTSAWALAAGEATLFEGDWTKGGYRIDGRWSIVEDENGRWVVLDDDFKTRRAPDLKIFLSKQPLSSVGDGTATRGSVLVAPLERFKGAYRYRIPANVDPGEYRSILIHCEQYSKYWGGSELRSTE